MKKWTVSLSSSFDAIVAKQDKTFVCNRSCKLKDADELSTKLNGADAQL